MTLSRRRWLIVTAAVVVVIAAGSIGRHVVGHFGSLQKAASVKLGMSQADVSKIMGKEEAVSGGGGGGVWVLNLFYGRNIRMSVENEFRSWLGLAIREWKPEDYSVEISIEQGSDKVFSIRRGNEVVEQE